MKKAIVVYGGWEGHQPREVAAILEHQLKEEQFEVVMSDTLDIFRDGELMKSVDLVVMQWTMGTIEKDQLEPLLQAVKSGVGIAGSHGGMTDAFRQQVEYQYMVGGQWVSHPGGDGVVYIVENKSPQHEIMEGIDHFEVSSEKYYMHVDPKINVLATTDFDGVAMPVTWTTKYGEGRVFHCTLGHQANIVDMPPVLKMMRRGMVWAAK